MHPGLGRDHYERKSSREALRSLKRQLAKVVYRHLVADQVRRLDLASSDRGASFSGSASSFAGSWLER